ncbi:carboxypeptidase C prc1 [Chytriomyces hyalinus]|nr:carboxypeptidase C prc1 [Chytriomyces hyalinus]
MALVPKKRSEPFFLSLPQSVRLSLGHSIATETASNASSSPSSPFLSSSAWRDFKPTAASNTAKPSKRNRTRSAPVITPSVSSPLNPVSRFLLACPPQPRKMKSLSNINNHSTHSLIATARHLLLSLESMWAEVTNDFANAPPKNSGTGKVVINGVEWADRKQENGSQENSSASNAVREAALLCKNRERTVSEEVAEINAQFFFEKFNSDNNNSNNAMISSPHSSHPGSPKLDKKVLDALRNEQIINNKALLPIISSLETLIQEEHDRRNAVMDAIQSLHDQLFSACELLCVPIETFVNARNFPSNASIYAKRDILKTRVTHVESVIAARKERLSALKTAVATIRTALEDLAETEFEAVAGDDLSAATVDAWAKALYDLEEERNTRQTQISKLCADIYKTSTLLNNAFPQASDQERALTEFLQTPIPAQSAISSSLPHLPVLTGSADGPTSARASSLSETVQLQRHYKNLLNDSSNPSSNALNEPAGTSPRVSMSITRACIQWLKEIAARMDAQLKQRRERCKALVKEIEMCQEELNEDGLPSLDPTDLTRLEEYETIAEGLRTRWRVKMQEVVVRLLLDLTTWWDKCYLTAEERKEFTLQFGDNLFSPLTVERINLELLSLQSRHEAEHHIYALIESRRALLTRMTEFEHKTANDPTRLFRSSFQLNEEERFRKTCVPTLLKMEARLRKEIEDFERDQERWFMFRGVRHLSVLDQDIADRFVNEAVFVFDTAGASINRSTSMSNLKSPRSRKPSNVSTSPANARKTTKRGGDATPGTFGVGGGEKKIRGRGAVAAPAALV